MAEENIRSLITNLCREKRPLSGAEVKRKVDAFLQAENIPLSSLRDFWGNPDRTLGCFSELPSSIRWGLSQAAFHHSQEYYLLTTPLLHGAVLKNPLFWLGNRMVRLGWRLKSEEEDSHWMIHAGRFPMRVLRYAARALLEKLRFTRFYSAPPLLALWKYAGVDVADLTHRYIEAVPIDQTLGPVAELLQGDSEVSALLGIDLLFSEGRAFFVEGNVNAGFYENRLRVYPQGDPVCLSLIRYAKTRGYSEIRFNPADMYGYVFPKVVEESWQGLARREGIELRIIDDPINGSPYRRPQSLFVCPYETGILHVNGRYIEGPLGTMVVSKGRMEEAVRSFSEDSSRRSVHSPREIRSDAELSPISRNSRFPNIIVKNMYVDQARGIELFKINHIPPEVGRSFNKIYEYVVPDRIERGTEHSRKEFVFGFPS